MLFKKNDAKVYFHRFYDMKQTQVQDWKPIPLYIETFTNIDQENSAIMAAADGAIIVGRFTVIGFSATQLMDTLDGCDLVKVSPSSDKKFFGALCKDSKQLIVESLIIPKADKQTIETDFIIKTF